MVCVIYFSFELFLLCFNIRFTYSSFTGQIYNISMFIVLWQNLYNIINISSLKVGKDSTERRIWAKIIWELILS